MVARGFRSVRIAAVVAISAATLVATPGGPAAAADVAPGVPVERLPFAASVKVFTRGAGGPGTAAANAAVATACNGGAPLGKPQWFELPPADTGPVLVQVRGVDLTRGAVTAPSGSALVRTATGEVVGCSPSLVHPSAAGQLSVVGWLPRGEDCPRSEPWCSERELQLTLDPSGGYRPSNDAIAGATTVGSLPYRGWADTTLATTDGPQLIDYEHCALSTTLPAELRTVWWRYTPAATHLLDVRATSSGSPVAVGVAVQTPAGPVRAPTGFDPWECAQQWRVEKGRTYLIGVVIPYDDYFATATPTGGDVELILANLYATAFPKPGRPTGAGVSVDGAARSATLTWQPPGRSNSPVIGYLVHRDGTDLNGAGWYDMTLPPSARSFTFTALAPWEAYRLDVRAINHDGLGAQATRVVSAQGPAPSVPAGVRAETGLRSATVSWSPPAYTGAPVTGYRVRRFAAGERIAQSSLVVPASARSYRVAGLGAGPFEFDVAAVTGAGAGREVRTAPVSPPQTATPPAAVAATVDEATRSATLTWQPPDTGGAAVTGYRVARDGQDRDHHGPWSTVLPASARSQTFTRLTNWSRYRLSVQAVTSAGPGSEGVATAQLRTPERPTQLTATRGDGRVVLGWTPGSFWSYDDVTWRVRRYAGDGDTVLQEVTLGRNARSHPVTGLTNGTAYSFDVTARNEFGWGDVSARTAAVVPAALPSAPGIQPASPGAPGGPVTATAAWTGPASTGGIPLTGWRVTALRVDDAGAVVGSTLSPLLPPAARAHELALPQAGTYRFTVQAVNDIGVGPVSARSGPVAGR